MLGGRGSSIALAAGILLHLLFVASLFGQFLNPLFLEAEHCPGQAADYFGIWQAGDNLLHGVSIYDSQDWKNEAVRRVPYFYFYRYLPPTAYVAAVGAWLLDPWTSYVLWAALIEALLVAIVVWILRMRAFPLAERRWQAAVWLGFTPFYLEQWMGQFSFLMAALLWIVLRPTLPDRPRQAREDTPRGAAFVSWAASIAIKSYPALFALPYLRRGRWRPVALCAAAVVLVSAPYYLARPDDVGQFLRLNFHGLPPRILG
ncbi:MAG: glycosyltransferase family 87 protein, partial [Candidatus Eisenbacteria bacterium]